MTIEKDPRDTDQEQRDGAGAGGEDKGVRDDAGKETVEKTVEKTTEKTVEDGDATREREN